jgi:fused signal recognition particle receptor
MPIEIVIVVVVVVLVAAGLALLATRRKALPRPPEEKEALPPSPEAEAASEAPAPEARPSAEPGPAEPSAPSVALPVEKPKGRDLEAERERRRQQRERYKDGLAKTRGGFVARLARLFTGSPKVDDELKDAVEEVLFTADIGTSTAQRLLDEVTRALDKTEIADPDTVWSVIRRESLAILDLPAPPTDFDPSIKPYVLLMIGVNGVGKTTTLGKLAARHANAGRKVLLVAGDTFRAAAVEQLEVWAHRVGCAIHKGASKADPSSVIFEGISRGRKEGFDVVLCDTAGRLHTRKELMDELGKVRRAATKAIAHALPEAERAAVQGPHDTYLVLDATIGQNALQQAKLFKETMDFTGLVITKLDGTAKGGVVLGICDETKIPVRHIGIGEGVEDLRDFDPEEFADALYADRDKVARGAA